MIVPRPTTDAIYTQALSKGGALLPETCTLRCDIVRVFTLCFLTPTDAPARHLRVAGSV